jgi:hypothetical protein
MLFVQEKAGPFLEVTNGDRFIFEKRMTIQESIIERMA